MALELKTRIGNCQNCHPVKSGMPSTTCHGWQRLV